MSLKNIETGESWCSNQIVSIWFGVNSKFFLSTIKSIDVRCVWSCNSVVNRVNLMQFFPKSYQKISRFNVSMHKRFVMDELQAWKNLICNHENRFQRKFSIAQLKIILKRCSHQFCDYKIKITIFSMPQKIRYSDTSLYFLKNLSLIQDKTGLNCLGFALDSTICVWLYVSSSVYSC